MRVIGQLREKTKLPTPKGEPTNAGFSVPIEEPRPGEDVTPSGRISGRDDGRVVRGVLSEDRSEVLYESQWGRVTIPFVAFAWIIELPPKEKAQGGSK